jgi:hypothetical protein
LARILLTISAVNGITLHAAFSYLTLPAIIHAGDTQAAFRAAVLVLGTLRAIDPAIGNIAVAQIIRSCRSKEIGIGYWGFIQCRFF